MTALATAPSRTAAGLARGQAGFSSFSDIFDEFFGGFGGSQRRSGRERGSDLRYNLEITLEEAFTGKTVEIEVPTSVTCDVCSGNGAKPGTSPTTCPTCRGAGRVRASQGGFFHIERTCPACHGRGEVVKDPCTKCAGAGRVSQNRTLSVNIPAGIEDGTRIRLAGEGEAGVRGGPPGDLYIFLAIKPHAFFQREGADIFCRVPVSITTAALGGAFEVPTVDGERSRVKIPEGAQSGRQIRLKGKGMPVLRSRQSGDMYVQVVVETPQNLSRRQRELLEEFERVSSERNNPEFGGFLLQGEGFSGSDGGEVVVPSIALGDRPNRELSSLSVSRLTLRTRSVKYSLTDLWGWEALVRKTFWVLAVPVLLIAGFARPDAAEAAATFVIVSGVRTDGKGVVRIFSDVDANGTYAFRSQLIPFPQFSNDLPRVAAGDIDGDRNEELIVSSGKAASVKIYDLHSDGTVGPAVQTLPLGWVGAFVAAGDIDGDERDEVIAGENGGPRYKVFHDAGGDGILTDDPPQTLSAGASFTGGVRVATGNTNNTGGEEVILGSGPGTPSRVRIMTDTDLDGSLLDGTLVEVFSPFPEFRDGIQIASGMIESAGGNGAEVLVAGSGGIVKIFTDSNTDGLVRDGPLFDSLRPYFNVQSYLAAGDSDRSGTFVEVITAPSRGSGSRDVKIFDDNADVGPKISDNPLDDEFAGMPAGTTAGSYVALARVFKETYLSTGPVPLPDLATTTSAINVPAHAGRVLDVDLTLNITHTFDADLDVNLRHVPSGKVVTLFTDVPNMGSFGADGFNITLNDEAGADIGTVSGVDGQPVTGLFNLEGAALLSKFDGLDASGVWRLAITDNSGSDSGTLNSWSLVVSY